MIMEMNKDKYRGDMNKGKGRKLFLSPFFLYVVFLKIEIVFTSKKHNRCEQIKACICHKKMM